MTQQITQEQVIQHIREWTKENNKSPSVLIPQDDGSFHLGFYCGMGADNKPIEKLDPLYKQAITNLHISGKLKEISKSFTLYPGSHIFKKLVFHDDI
jgi:hypothetical protein